VKVQQLPSSDGKMDNNPHIKYIIPDRSFASIVKKEIRRQAEHIELSQKKIAETDIIVSELISNLNKHATGGELLIKTIEDLHGRNGLELISVDRGPGIKDLQEMLKDGSSTTTTLGQGLGAIKRLSDEFDIYSLRGWGTIVLSRIFVSKISIKPKNQKFTFHTIMLPKKGQMVCGDGYRLYHNNFDYKLIALDGLGHGPEAHKASVAAIKEFLSTGQISPAETIKILHRKINKTRGAVGMVIHLNSISDLAYYAGLGNISARILGMDKAKSLISYNGIIGHSIPNTLHTNQAGFPQHEVMIIYSDGLKSRWELNHLPNILNHDGSIIAAAVYKDFSRNTDDTLVIVIKNI